MFGILKIFLILQVASRLIDGQEKIGDACDQGKGNCIGMSQCLPVAAKFNNPNYKVPYCGDTDAVCCPNIQVSTIAKPIIIDENSPVDIRQCEAFHKLIKKCDPLPLIVNGVKAKAREYPHMAWLGTKIDGVLKQYCGGTLISEQYVLTAAHCMYSPDAQPGEFILNHVRLGVIDYTKPDGNTQEFGIKNQIDHPEYDLYTRYNDIAVLELDRPVILNEYVMPACLPLSYGSEVLSFVAIGWGLTGNAKNASTHLLKVNLEPFTDKECADKMGDADSNFLLDKGVHIRTQLCAGSKLNTSDTCPGDSGGPLFVQHDQYECMFTVFGVTSYGIGCGSIGWPGVYTRVYKFIDWIETVVWKMAVNV